MPQDRTRANDEAGLADGDGEGVALHAKRPLGDFTTDRRVLILVAMALVVGTGGALAAWLLVQLIALVTNLAWFGRLDIDADLAWPPRRGRSGWCCVPVARRARDRR